MAGFKVDVPHGLDSASAVNRLQGFSESIRRDYAGQISEVVETWTPDGRLEFSFKAMGFRISGDALIDATYVRLKGTLPLAAVMFRGAIERQIREKLVEALGRPS